MTRNRLESFSDAVIAVLLTIMVLELKPPEGMDWESFSPVLTKLLIYILSFVYLGIYWTNHHHLLHATRRVNGAILWANLHLLFWLSLIPFTTAWMGEEHFAPLPTASYGAVLLLSASSYTILQSAIIRFEGKTSQLAAWTGRDWKGKLSLLAYAGSIPLAFVNQWISACLFVLVALMWLVPDRRIESHFQGPEV